MGVALQQFGPDSQVTARMIADRSRLAVALGADADDDSHQSELLRSDPVRGFLFRAITRQRNQGMLPDDVFETMLKSAQTDAGRKCLLSFFNAPEALRK